MNKRAGGQERKDIQAHMRVVSPTLRVLLKGKGAESSTKVEPEGKSTIKKEEHSETLDSARPENDSAPSSLGV